MSKDMRSKSNLMVTAKEMKEASLKARRKNIMYLVLNFLQNEGMFKTADSLVSEAHLSNDYQVCDNVDLEIVYQEYCNYFLLKYDKNPLVCKKIENFNNTVVKKQQPPKMKINKENQNVCKNPDEPKENNIEDCIIVNKFVNQSLKTTNEHFEEDVNLKESTVSPKRLTEYLSNVPDELKGFVRDVYHNSKLENNSVEWNEIVGLENAKTLLKEACVYPSKYPKLFNGLTTPWRGILLYGPPGAGKTLLAKAIANESNRMFLNITSSLIVSKWRGESERNIRILFDLARHCGPSIIFIDEIEAVASKRDCPMEHEASRRLKTEIFIELDGVGKTSDDILFLVTSNLPWEIDSALLRRLEKRIYISLPDRENRTKMFESLINTCNIDYEKNINYDELAKMTDGYSGSDIRNICREACMSTIRNYINKTDNSVRHMYELKQVDIELAIQRTKPASKYNIEKYEKCLENMGAE